MGLGAPACSTSEGVVADEVDASGSLAASRNGGGEGVVVTECGLENAFGCDLLKLSVLGDDAGVGVLESL